MANCLHCNRLHNQLFIQFGFIFLLLVIILFKSHSEIFDNYLVVVIFHFFCTLFYAENTQEVGGQFCGNMQRLSSVQYNIICMVSNMYLKQVSDKVWNHVNIFKIAQNNIYETLHTITPWSVTHLMSYSLLLLYFWFHQKYPELIKI